MATAETDTVATEGETRDRSVLGAWWAIALFTLLMLLALGWKFIADPSLSAPTRDPAWYTWRAQVILQGDPVRVVQEWGPNGLFAGGYRVTVPLAGALLQQVVGIDRYSFSAFLMIGIPVLTGLALGAALYRSRRDPLVVFTTLLASVGLFLTTPYVGYLDNITVLFLLALTIPFVHEARTSWGARTALFLIGAAAAFTHPTTCVVFGVVLMAVFGFHFLTSRFSLGAALKSDGPMLLSTGFGMVAGLACWVVGIWGASASLAEAALPPPYTAAFFRARLMEWIWSLQPVVIVPFILIAIVSTVLLARRTRTPARNEDQVSIWWLLAFAGIATVLTGTALPYYRFMNASAAPMALVGLGAFVAIRWLLSGDRIPKVAGALGAVLVVGSLGWVVYDGLENRWVNENNQWANEQVRTSLAAVHEVVAAAGERPNVLLVNFGDTDDPQTNTNTGYGWSKTYSNVFRTGLPGDAIDRSVTYFGTLENFLAAEPTTSSVGSEGYDDIAAAHFCETFGGPEALCDPKGKKPEDWIPRLQEYPEEPVVFLIGQYYGGLCNGVEGCDADVQQQRLEAAMAQGVEVGPDVVVIQGEGLWSPPSDVVDRAQLAADRAETLFDNHPSAFGNIPSTLLVIALLALLLVVPGLLAAGWFGLRTSIDRFALIPGMSIVMLLLSGIAVLAVWRGSLTTPKAWTVVAVAIAMGAALRVADRWLLKPLTASAAYFDRLFAQFSNRDFSVLMGTQYLVQTGQGVVQGAIATSIAFGGQQGFDVQNLPSAGYLLQVVLALYIPYTFVSPFVGVFIDRFQRRRVVWWTTLATSATAAIVAVAVLYPLQGDTTEGKPWYVFFGLVLGLLAVQAATRVVLAVKSAALPDVLSGKDLLQANGLSQAGGGLFQIGGIVVGTVAAGFAPPALGVLLGAGVLVLAGITALQLRNTELAPREATFGKEVAVVFGRISAGLKELAARPPAALSLSSFQMLRYQFWGFGLFTFGLYSKNLAAGGDAETLSLILSGMGGLLGGVIGVVVAQRLKDRVPPIRVLLTSMVLLGVATLLGGLLLSVLGFALMLFVGFFSFFLGKISADTITQQAMPDDFRGRAFALFDVAYNLGYIVPALILYLVWAENSPATTRLILLVSGAVFLGLTFAVYGWSRKIREQFAPQDDLVGEPAAEVAAAKE
jgi:MFS family permease